MFHHMSVPSFLLFDPVPLKARHDGWSPELQRRFVVALARGASVDGAALGVGKSRTTAYGLRKRPGAEAFAVAWDEALAYARRVRIAAARAERAERAARRMAAAARYAPGAEPILESLYPGFPRPAAEGGKAAEAGKADEADRA